MQSMNILFTGKDQVELRPEQLRELGNDEVLVAACKTLISSGTEKICLHRLFESGSHWSRWVTYPFAPGYSMVGRIVATERSVREFKKGDRVALRRPHRQYTIVSTRSLYPIPQEVSDEDATWFGLSTIVQNAVRRAEHRLGDCVVVIGLGPLGQLVVQYVRLLGARSIIVIDATQRRLDWAQKHGATATVALRAEAARKIVLDLSDGFGADVVYDVTGNASVLAAALPLVRRFGRLILLGDTGEPSAQHLTGDVVTRGLKIIGAHDNNPPEVSTDHAYWSHQRMASLFFTYLSRGDMSVSDLITHRFSPFDAPLAYRALYEERSSIMGVLFDWTRL